MLRGALWVIILVLVGMAVLPFLLSSLYIDQRGVNIPGHVSYKREYLSTRYGTLKRHAAITVEYSKPDGSGVGFLDVPLPDAEYDASHVGQTVSLHYLRPQDLPKFPLVKVLRQMQMLPMVHLANKTTWSPLAVLWTSQNTVIAGVAAGMLMLLIGWRLARVPGLKWAVTASVLGGLTALQIADFYRPMPAPTVEVRQAMGRVTSLQRVNRLFNGSKRRGFVTAQPIQIATIEFTPEGRTDPVMAVDLIDAGSVAGLKEKSAVPVIYESQSPRTAYVQGATRTFAARNVAGLGVQIVEGVAILLAFVALCFLISRATGGWRAPRLSRRAGNTVN